jgi:transposase
MGRKANLPSTIFDHENEFKEAVITAQEEKSGGRIKGTDIQKILLNQFDVEYSLTSVYDLLHRLKLVWISVRSKHPSQDQEIQDNFKKISKKM